MGMRAIINGVFLVLLLFIVSWWTVSVYAAESAIKETTNTRQKDDLNAMAANSIDDTLKTCLARIPKVATSGPRLLAERSCQGEEKARQATQATPRS